MSHVSREAMLRWRDEGLADDREQMTSHLAACRSCAAAYAEMVRTRPIADRPVHFEPADFVQRGYAARKRAAPSRRTVAAPWKLWAGALGAAAALVLVVVFVPFGSDDVMRGSGVTIVSPANVGSASSAEFDWTSGIAARRFRVQLTDASGSVLYQALVSAPPVHPPPDVARRLQPGQSYTWTVSAMDADARVIATASRTFSPGGAAR
jgi:anti-sigma factor RsiW